MKTERITFLASPDFKQYLATQAANDGISVGELIRSRCMSAQKGTDAQQERELSDLTALLQHSIVEARSSLQEGLQAAEMAMNSIRNAHGDAAQSQKEAA